MNFSHLEHAVVAVSMLLALFAIFKNQWIGAAFGIAFYLGREVHEFERVARRAGDDSFFAGAKMWMWSLDAWLDFLSPLVCCLAVACIISRITNVRRPKKDEPPRDVGKSG